MDRVNGIIHNSDYIHMLEIIDENEEKRIYCRHGYSHLLDVARMMYIESMERDLNIPKDVIYATALLHDIGRSVSDEFHDEESAKIAVHILGVAHYNDEEISMIVEAIMSHRKGSETPLGDLLYRNDKLSRNCYYCKSQDGCKWKVKNKELIR